MMTDAPEKVRVHIRWMIRRDMAEVLDIERTVFQFPWFEEEFIRCLRQRNCIGMVAEAAEQVVGFMIYELHKTRLELLNIAVSKNNQRRCVGRQMIEKLIGKLSLQRRLKIKVPVRETNLSAQLFFRRMGFVALGLEPDFYEDSPEPAILFEYQHDPSKLPPHLVLPATARPARCECPSLTLKEVHAHILHCAKKGTGCKLSADEVKQLAKELGNQIL